MFINKTQRVGSIGKGLGFCGSLMRSKVSNPLQCKQFLRVSQPAKYEYYPIRVKEAL